MGGNNEEKSVSEMKSIGEADLSRTQYSAPQAIACDYDFVSDPPVTNLSLLDLPSEILTKIFSYLDYDTIAYLRPVSHRMDRVCSSILNSTFQKLQVQISRRYEAITAQVGSYRPRSYSCPLQTELFFIGVLNSGLTGFHIILEKHIELEHCCFFPGKILDVVYHILRSIKPFIHTLLPMYIYMRDLVDEFFDLSAMARKYFNENIKPRLKRLTDGINLKKKLLAILQLRNEERSSRGVPVIDISVPGAKKWMYIVQRAITCDCDFVSDPPVANLNLLNLPSEILTKIFSYLDYDTIAYLRPVSHRMDRVCSSILNSTFQKLQVQISRRYEAITAQITSHPSASSDHPLENELRIIDRLNRHLNFWHRKLGKYIEQKRCCFFPGKILDVVYHILRSIKPCIHTQHSIFTYMHNLLDEFYDLSTMAWMYYKENIKPRLTRLIYEIYFKKKLLRILRLRNEGRSSSGEPVVDIGVLGIPKWMYALQEAITCDCDFVSDPPVANLNLLNLPFEILRKIFSYLDYNTIAHLRPVSHQMDRVCSSILNSSFKKLQVQIKSHDQAIRVQMPRRPSACRNHPLAYELDIIHRLDTLISILQRRLEEYIETKNCCFFPGKILDEGYHILHYIKATPNIPKPFRELNEFNDLCIMANAFFLEDIEPKMPKIVCGLHNMLRKADMFAFQNIEVSKIGELYPTKRKPKRKGRKVPKAIACDWDFISNPPVANLNLLDLPFEILRKIFSYLDYNAIAHLRPVCHQMDRVCGSILNFTFKRLQVEIKSLEQTFGAQMPRRPSACRQHSLANELDFIYGLDTHISILQRKFKKHIERKNCCFFPGKILDEICSILRNVKLISKLPVSEKPVYFDYVMDDFQNLCGMAKEHFELHIEPSFS